jgi:GPI mannosyltransferase 2
VETLLQITRHNGSGVKIRFQAFTVSSKAIIGKCNSSHETLVGCPSDFFYRNVGFLRYWTLSNIPLFVLAFPMLTIMVISSLWAMEMRDGSNMASGLLKPTTGPLESIEQRLLKSLAAPQLLLAILALTSYHVQIITRISSGYCIWYFCLAHSLMVSTEESPKPKADKTNSWRLSRSSEMVRYIVVYAAVQAGLFSSFLPPA